MSNLFEIKNLKKHYEIKKGFFATPTIIKAVKVTHENATSIRPSMLS